MPILDENGSIYELYKYSTESEFEKDVVGYAEYLFGPSSIYIDVKKRIVGNNIISIPDGYVIDFADVDSPKLFIIENEIVEHDPFKHIGIQMLRFVTSFDDSQKLIRDFLMEEINNNKDYVAKLERAVEQSSIRNIDNFLDEAVYSDFRGIVVIDDARDELHHVISRINANISVLEFKAYVSEGKKKLFEFDSLYDEYEETTLETKEQKRISPELLKLRRKRRASADTIIVPAREDGFKRVFLGDNCWWAIRIGAAMKEQLKYIAAYQVAPISAITHIAEIEDIRPYKDTGKYLVTFKGAAQEIRPITLEDPKNSPQGPVYVKREALLKAKTFEEAMMNI